MRSDASERERPASELITARIEELGDWRGEKLALVRRLIHEADPAILEEWKWRGTPVWSHDGIVCTGETYKQTVKLTFAKGAFLENPRHLFNAGLTGNVRRAIDLRAEDELDGRRVPGLDPGGRRLQPGPSSPATSVLQNGRVRSLSAPVRGPARGSKVPPRARIRAPARRYASSLDAYRQPSGTREQGAAARAARA